VGYSLTGTVGERVLFVLYGEGANGKSTFLEVLMAVLGDYAGPAAPGLLLARSTESHPTDMADLFGRRMATSMETGEGRRFDEARATVQEASRRLRELTGEYDAARLTALFSTFAGDHETAARSWRVVCDGIEARGNLTVLSTFAPALGRSLCAIGRYDEAEPLAQLGRELGDEQDMVTQMLWRQVQALVLSQRGQHEEAERLAREAVAIGERTDALVWQGDALCDLAGVLERAGGPQDAAAVLEQALERYERKGNVAMVTQARQRLTAGKDAKGEIRTWNSR
jgi:tetratricopeptide (TPR) repeat protein